jgi:uncharacterized protein involved in copper resistance
MDTLTRTLIIELAKTALRVLDAQPATTAQPVNREAVPTPWATAINREADKGAPPPMNSKAAALEMLDKKADKGIPKQLAQLTTTELVAKLKNPDAGPVLGREAGAAQRGDKVRFWDGHRYSIGTVQNICRKKVGQPASVTVRVERGEGRKGKTHKVEAAKAEVIKGVTNG